MAEKIKKSIKIFLLITAVTFGTLGIVFGIQARYAVTGADIRLEKNQNIEPEEAVVVDLPMLPFSEDYADGIRIVPDTVVNFRLDRGKKKLAIVPQKFWKPETDYKIVLPEGRTAILSKMDKSELSFSTVRYPRVSSLTPVDGSVDVILDAESPITVDFDKPTKGFFIDFVLDPNGPIIYQNNPEKTQFKLLPKENFPDGQKYNIKIFAKYVEEDDGGYFKIYESTFKTFLPANLVWEKDFNLRLEQARRFTRPQITAGKYIDINLANQVLTTFQDGKILNAYLVSSGMRGMDTPKGTYKIENKHPRAFSRGYGLYMPWWMALVSGGKFGIHELPEWPGGYKEGANHLGMPVSHGCIRLGVGAAKTIYDWAELGNPVVVH